MISHLPVGEDQLQHVEMARDLARRFNASYGPTFKEPQSLGSVLDMNNLPRSNGGCTSCTQQAFRDLSYVLRAYDRFHSIKDGFIPGRVGNVVTRGPGWMSEMRTLFQLLTGGFV